MIMSIAQEKNPISRQKAFYMSSSLNLAMASPASRDIIEAKCADIVGMVDFDYTQYTAFQHLIS